MTGLNVPAVEWPRTTITRSITKRQALDEARRTYDELYRTVEAAVDGAEAEQASRVYHRGLATFAELHPTDGQLSIAASEAFRAYIDAATSGDAEANFAWLKMMPRVVSEVTARVAEPWVFKRTAAAAYKVLLTTALQDFDVTVIAHQAAEVQVRYTVSRIDAVSHWTFVTPPDWLSLASLMRDYLAAKPPRRADSERQPALALAA
jgi:hypothetical protein